MGVDLCLLAHGTSEDVVADKGSHTWFTNSPFVQVPELQIGLGVLWVRGHGIASRCRSIGSSLLGHSTVSGKRLSRPRVEVGALARYSLIVPSPFSYHT